MKARIDQSRSGKSILVTFLEGYSTYTITVPMPYAVRFFAEGARASLETLRAGRRKKSETPKVDDCIRLWYQGPSYTVFRRCLHYPPEAQWKSIEGLLEILEFTETRMYVSFEEDSRMESDRIRWTWFNDIHAWAEGFPYLEE